MPREKSKEVEALEEKAGYAAVGVYVFDANGMKRLARTYTVEQHGKRAAEYAEEYAKKIHGEVRKVE